MLGGRVPGSDADPGLMNIDTFRIRVCFMEAVNISKRNGFNYAGAY